MIPKWFYKQWQKGSKILKACSPDWDLNPLSFNWDHTWSQDLTNLGFLMSHYRKNSVRDKVIGKKWIYLERNTFQRQNAVHLKWWEQLWKENTPQSVGHLRRQVALKYGMVSFYGLMSARGLLQLLWRGGRHFQELGHQLRTVMALMSLSFSMLMHYNEHSSSS